MRTERTPTTALSGGHASEDSLAASTTILAAPYIVFKLDSFDGPGSSGAAPLKSEDVGIQDNATATGNAARALWSLARLNVASSLLARSTGGVGVGGPLCVGVDCDEGFFRKWCMVDGGIERNNVCESPSPARRLNVIVRRSILWTPEFGAQARSFRLTCH